MIRPITADDIAALLTVISATGLFPPDEHAEVAQMLSDAVGGASAADDCWVTDDDDRAGPVGVVYYAPERMTEGTWNMYLLAVHPDHQGQGRGTALVRYVEQTLRAGGARVLLVETSGLPDFARTRAFYRACGYHEEARIRDFYRAGDDKIVFWKALAQPVP